MQDPSKPNNKLVNNFPGYIVDVMQGYFVGKPITYSSTEEEYLSRLQDIFNYNDEQDENSELAKTMGIKGKVYELLYVDEDTMPRFNLVDPENMILVYDTKITPEPVLAIRYYRIDNLDGEEKTKIEVYTDNTIQFYVMNGEDLALEDEKEHFFGSVPVIEYLNNDEGIGDFEKVLTLIDAYDKAQSDTLNDFEYFADAYLALVGMGGTDSEDIKQMKENRVLLLEENGQANWLIKEINDAASENYKTRLQQDIHRFSKTPSLTDENFGSNLSGVAISYKVWGMEQVAATKERKFKRALQRRIELLTNFLNIKGGNYDWRDIQITFTRNLPRNLVEITDMVSKLNGIISDETLLAQLPMIDDVQAELERIEVQNAGKINLDDIEDEDENS
jgi:SPP1 family phage portal protein